MAAPAFTLVKSKSHDRLREAVSAGLAHQAIKRVRKMSPEIMLCLVEDQLQTFGEESDLIRRALHSEEIGAFRAARRASPALLAKVLAAMILRYELGSEQSRAALLSAFEIDRSVVEWQVSKDWAKGAFQINPPKRVPEMRIVTHVPDGQFEFKFSWLKV